MHHNLLDGRVFFSEALCIALTGCQDVHTLTDKKVRHWKEKSTYAKSLLTNF